MRSAPILALGLISAAAGTAHAACPSTETVLEALTCSSSVSSALDSTGISDLGGSCSPPAKDCYTCGSPYADLDQEEVEDVYSFSCQATGTVTLDIADMDCDVDVYVLGDRCDPYRDCEDGITQSSTSDATLSFSCTAGDTYYVVVEGYGLSLSSSDSGWCDASASDGSYTLSFQADATGGCHEDCDDGTDEDGDGDTDCADSDCASDPVCDCDADGDGYDDTRAACGGSDCDDDDAAVNPGATEACTGVDDDCDGLVDDDDPSLGGASTWFADADADGFGDAASTVAACDAPSGYVADDSDCDDADASAWPGAEETCDGADDDCDGTVDEEAVDASTWYADTDADGYGDLASSTAACSAPSGHVADSTDCDDGDSGVYPGAAETCDGVDEDCNGSVDDSASDASTWYADADGDGYGEASSTTEACTLPSGYSADSTDCDDTDALIYPGATELCDGLDNDCDGSTDESASGARTWFADADGDGYGDSGTSTSSCSTPSGYVGNAEDCDDTDASVSPAATETCDGEDDDCDGDVDEDDASDATTWYADADSDGYGDASTDRTACAAPSGYVADATDCDDGSAGVNPAATETCDGEDDDCDGTTDEADASDASTWYDDADGDGYGDAAASTVACDAPSGAVADASDCDDTDAAVSPGATELCNGIDDDCDGTTDGSGASDVSRWFTDADGDGYGDPATGAWACEAPSGAVSDNDDCDDADAAIHPGATETCDGEDDDCDGETDEDDASDASTWYEDADGDGYGADDSSTNACAAPTGWVADGGDCDDGDDQTWPGATEVCDGVDNDCDGTADEGATADRTWYLDSDGDGWGDSASTTTSCTQPSGYEADGGDCDDADALVSPGADELCDGVDNDCDGSTDEDDATDGTTWYEDADGDGYGDLKSTASACTVPSGYVASAEDCDDADASVFPGADEWCDGADTDCDGVEDEDDALDALTWYADDDGDGYGDAASTTTACEAPSGYVDDDGDCDDTDASWSPAAEDVPWDGLDQDCDGADLCDADGDGADEDGSSCGGTDCDDTDADVYPGASESADGVDEDCDGTVDEGTAWVDDDGDGFAEVGGDCDDGDAGIAPGTPESCDGVDEDCDGTVDEGTDCRDDDGDGYSEQGGDCDDDDPTIGPHVVEVEGNGIDDDCDGDVDGGSYDGDGDGWSRAGGDCDDEDPEVHPGADEVADGRDDDCDGTVDEGTAAFDDDLDGWSEEEGDCDDTDPGVHPDALETADGVDEDCNGIVDDGTERTDDDGDGYSEVGGDCDDADPLAYPGAEEVDGGADEDCDGLVDEHLDADGDGHSAADGDCDDGDGWTWAGAPEMCDGVDNDCDGEVDEACAEPAGCASAPSGGGGILLLLLPLVRVRRRL